MRRFGRTRGSARLLTGGLARVGFRRCEVTRRAAFVAASGRVRADGRSSRPRNTLPAPDRRPRVSFVGRFGTEFAPRRRDSADFSCPPPSARRAKLRRWKPSPSARGARGPPREPSPASPWDPGRRYARGHGERSRSARPLRRAAVAEERARPRSPSRQLFVRLRAPPWRSIGSSPPLPAQAPSESASKRLSSEDVIKYTKDFIVQFREVRRTRRRLRPAGAGSLPRVIAPPIRALVAPSPGRQSVFSGNDETKGFFFLERRARHTRARHTRLRPPSERRSSVRRAPRTTSTDTFGPPRTRFCTLSVASSRRRRDARRCPSSSRRPLWKS